LDEIRIHLVPVLLGKGKRLFDHLGNQRIDLERTSVVEVPEGVIHLRFHVARYLPARSAERSGMTDQQDLEAIARAIMDANQYMTLGTAGETGRPWVSPVWYALAHYPGVLLGLVAGGDAFAQPRGAPAAEHRDL
jgi:hypothetical protein